MVRVLDTSETLLPQEHADALRRAILNHYDKHSRALPWRETRDPYLVWLSEVMLQQTRVETVIPYFERFRSRFPTPEHLARAEEDEVMSLWSGLGYYRRARQLHQGVRDVVARYGGQVPQDPAERRALPGVGRYTAGAIGSIAFGLEEPVVDGNVARVFCRFFGIDTPLGKAVTQKRLWSIAEALVAGPRPGDFNQALMEFGATVCKPRGPTCRQCPIAAACVARKSGRVDSLPTPARKTAPRRVTWEVVLAVDGDGVWLCRQDEGLFAGLWTPPLVFASGRASVLEHLAAIGLSGNLAKRRAFSVRHTLSHREATVHAWKLTDVSASESSTMKRFSAAEWSAVGLSSLSKRVLSRSGLLSDQRLLFE